MGLAYNGKQAERHKCEKNGKNAENSPRSKVGKNSRKISQKLENRAKFHFLVFFAHFFSILIGAHDCNPSPGKSSIWRAEETSENGLGSQSSAEPLGFCVRVLQQVFYCAKGTSEPSYRTPKVLQNSGGRGLGAQASLLRTGLFPPPRASQKTKENRRGLGSVTLSAALVEHTLAIFVGAFFEINPGILCRMKIHGH